MFTGLIREIGEVISFSNNTLSIKSNYKPKIGDSIAVNGACLTVIESFNNSFSVELSLETQHIIATENLKEKVHIEPAMRLSDRLDGHLLQGHVDCLGILKDIKKNGNSLDFFISIPKEFIKFCIPKGSIGIDGVSLTINEVFSDTIRLTIIPHTLKWTLFGSYEKNRRLNIETDLIVRSIYHLMHKDKACSWQEIDKMLALY